MGNPIPYFPVSTTDNTGAVLTIRTKETINGKFTEGATVPNSDWKFCGGGTFAGADAGDHAAGAASASRNGFDPTKLYQLVYTVKDPYVLGVGTAAFRDVGSFFRYGAGDFGTAIRSPARSRGRSSAARRSRATSRATSSTSA